MQFTFSVLSVTSVAQRFFPSSQLARIKSAAKNHFE